MPNENTQNSDVDLLETCQTTLSRQGYTVRVEDGRLRFIAGHEDVWQNVLDAINSEEDDEPLLSRQLHEMGLDVDVDSNCLIAYPAI